MEAMERPGWVEVITGPMFAGKSEELIRRIRRLEYAHKNLLVFKPIIDNRYSKNDVVSHLQNKHQAIAVANPMEILAKIKPDTDAVAIDEAQFFDRSLADVADTLASQGIRVIVDGLDTDFRGQAFMVTAELMARAEFVTKLTAICVKCGAPATMTQRIVNGIPAKYDDPIVLVGASESYEPRCRHCHVILR
jgi:thymidine kinase